MNETILMLNIQTLLDRVSVFIEYHLNDIDEKDKTVIKNDAIKTLTLDVNGIEFIDSAALGMFLIAREEAEKRQIKIILKNPQGQLAQMFKVSKFDTLFTIQ